MCGGCGCSCERSVAGQFKWLQNPAEATIGGMCTRYLGEIQGERVAVVGRYMYYAMWEFGRGRGWRGQIQSRNSDGFWQAWARLVLGAGTEAMVGKRRTGQARDGADYQS